MFKKLLQRIIDAETQRAAWDNVFYGNDGIDMMYQKEKITWKEHQMLVQVIERMAND